MKAAVLTPGFIPVVILVIIGIMIKYKKAYWLISGYNTMSAEKKKNVDIEGLGKFTANICFVIAGLIFVAAILIFIGKAPASLIVFALIIPIAIYSLIKAQQYDGNSRDKNGRMKTGTKVLIGSIIGFLILVATGVGILLHFSSQPAEYTFENGILKISGMYGQQVTVYEITELEIKDSIPEVLMKTNGSGLGTMLKGYFRLEYIGEAKLFVDVSKKPFIYIKSNNSKLIILNCEENGKTLELYNKLSEEWHKSVGKYLPGLQDDSDISGKVEKNLSVIMSSPKASSNPGDYVKAHQAEYENILKMGDAALDYMLSCFKENNAQGLKGHIMMSLCKEILGDRNNIREGDYQSPEEWYSKLAPYSSAKLSEFKYTGTDNLEQLVYSAALKRYDKNNDESTLTVVAPHIFGTYEQKNELRIFATVYYSSFKLYGKTLSEEGGGIVPAAIIYSKDNDGKYTFKEYIEAQDGSYFQSSIKKFCKPRNDIADSILKHYGNYSDLFNIMKQNIKTYLRDNDLAGISIKQSNGAIIPVS